MDRGPALLSVQVAGVTAVGSVLTVLPGDVVGLPPAAAGAAVLAVGAVRGSRRLVTAGAALLFFGVLAGALTADDPLLALLGAALAFVAWDTAEHGIGVGEQLGRDAPTRRLEVTHAAASAIVGLLAVAAGYGAYTVAWGGLPSAALVLFLLGALLLTWTLR
ncbi:MAG: hypothetical protein ABEH77_06340 [Halobacteriaceae archaeon]